MACNLVRIADVAKLQLNGKIGTNVGLALCLVHRAATGTQ
jgi:hypothetical protein